MSGKSGLKDFVLPGKYTTKPVDGVATSKYSDAIFKVPDYGKVIVRPGGNVEFTNPVTVKASTTLAGLNSTISGRGAYVYGWISKFNMNTGEYNYWKPLLNKAFLINSLAR
jgi:hypothetical protein